MDKTLSPQKANTEQKVCSLNRDNTDTGDFWMLVDDGSVTICEQKPGERHEGMLTIPKADFNKMIRWYLRPQKIRRR